MTQPAHIRFLSTPQAASYLGLSESLLEKLRLRGGGPPYSKPTPRRVVYAVDDLDLWAESHRRDSTTDRAA